VCSFPNQVSVCVELTCISRVLAQQAVTESSDTRPHSTTTKPE